MKMSEVNKCRDKSACFECPTDRRPQIFRPWENQSHKVGASPVEVSRITNSTNSDGRRYEYNNLPCQFTTDLESSSNHRFRVNFGTNATSRSLLFADLLSKSFSARHKERLAAVYCQKYKPYEKCRHQILSSSCVHCCSSVNLRYSMQTETSPCCSHGHSGCYVNDFRGSRRYQSNSVCCRNCQIEAVSDQEVPGNGYHCNLEYDDEFAVSSRNYYMSSETRSSSVNMQGEHLTGHQILHGFKRPGQDDLLCCCIGCSTCINTHNSPSSQVATGTCLHRERNTRTVTEYQSLFRNMFADENNCSSSNTKNVLQTHCQNATFQRNTVCEDAKRQDMRTAAMPYRPMRSREIARVSNVGLPICSTYFNPSETAGYKVGSRVVRNAREAVLDVSEMKDEGGWSEMSSYCGIDGVASSRHLTSDESEDSPVIDIEAGNRNNGSRDLCIFLPEKSDCTIDDNNNIGCTNTSNVELGDMMKRRTNVGVRIDTQPVNGIKVSNPFTENVLNVVGNNPLVFEAEDPLSASSFLQNNDFRSMEYIQGCEADDTKTPNFPDLSPNQTVLTNLMANDTKTPNMPDLSPNQNVLAHSDTRTELSKCANLSESSQLSDVGFCKSDVLADSNAKVPQDTFESVIDDVLKDMDLMRGLSQNLLGSSNDGGTGGAQYLGYGYPWSAEGPFSSTCSEGYGTFGSCDLSNQSSRQARNNFVSFRSTRTPVRRTGKNPKRRFQKRFPRPLPRSGRKAVNNERMLLEAAECFLRNYDVRRQRSCRRKSLENNATGLKCDCKLNDHNAQESEEKRKVHRGCELLVNPVSGKIEEVDIDTKYDGLNENPPNDVSKENVQEECKMMEVDKEDIDTWIPNDVQNADRVDEIVCMNKTDTSLPPPNAVDLANEHAFRHTVENGSTGTVLLSSKIRIGVENDRKRSQKYKCKAACKEKKITAKICKNYVVAKPDSNKVCARLKGKPKNGLKRIRTASQNKFSMSKLVEKMANLNATVQEQKSSKAETTPDVHKSIESDTAGTIARGERTSLQTIDATKSKACRLCGDVFDHENLIRHYMAKHGEWCIKCRKQFQSKEARREHVRKNHDVTVFCGTCNVSFVYRGSYRRHLKTEKHLSRSADVNTAEKLSAPVSSSASSTSIDDVCTSVSVDTADVNTAEKLPALVSTSASLNGIDDVCTSVSVDKACSVKDAKKDVARTECSIRSSDCTISDGLDRKHSLKRREAYEIGLLNKDAKSHKCLNLNLVLKEAANVPKAWLPKRVRWKSISDGSDDESKKRTDTIGKMKTTKPIRTVRLEDDRNTRSEDETEPTRRRSPCPQVLNPSLDGLLVAGIAPNPSQVSLANLIGNDTTVDGLCKSDVNKLPVTHGRPAQLGSKFSAKLVGATKRKYNRRPKEKRIDGNSGSDSDKMSKVAKAMCWVCEKKYVCMRTHLKTMKHKEKASRLKQC